MLTHKLLGIALLFTLFIAGALPIALAETYSFIIAWGGNGTGNGQFSLPLGVTVNGSGNVYVADDGSDRVEKFSNDGTFATA